MIIVWIVGVTALTPIATVLAMQTPATAGSICSASGSAIVLSYDDGEVMDYVSEVCPSCIRFQGVRFSLPSGVPTAAISWVQFYCKTSKRGAEVDVYVLGADRSTSLIPKITHAVQETGWQTVYLEDAVASGDFYVFVRRLTENTTLAYDIFHEYDRSYNGEHYKGLQVWNKGDIMIRAGVVAEIHVGKGQPYATIQAAVDSAFTGANIFVHEGTYNENVTVSKSVAIKSFSGPAKTVVQTSPPYSDNNVFRITASCVTLSGLTIKSATYDGRAGVYIDDASNCLISGNVIQDNNYGIYISEGSTSNILLENECRYNATGIFVDGSDNYVSGNRLHGNTALRGSAVFLSSVASGNHLLFNTITVDEGTDPTLAGSPQVYNESSAEEAKAVENWWGTDSGPSDAGGQGPDIGGMVDYAPWLTKQPLRVKTSPTGGGDYTISAMEEMSVTVLKQGTGTPVVSAASFGENPFGEFPGKPMGRWVDVLFNNASGVDQAEIRVYYTAAELAALDLKEGSVRLFWWNGEKWKKCSKTGVDKEGDFVWVRLNLKTNPTSNDLGGTMFAVGVPKASFAWWLIPLIFLIVIIALILFRVFWVLVVKRERYTID
jgi:parallel beta-helix repeat protein